MDILVKCAPVGTSRNFRACGTWNLEIVANLSGLLELQRGANFDASLM